MTVWKIDPWSASFTTVSLYKAMKSVIGLGKPHRFDFNFAKRINEDEMSGVAVESGFVLINEGFSWHR